METSVLTDNPYFKRKVTVKGEVKYFYQSRICIVMARTHVHWFQKGENEQAQYPDDWNSPEWFRPFLKEAKMNCLAKKRMRLQIRKKEDAQELVRQIKETISLSYPKGKKWRDSSLHRKEALPFLEEVLKWCLYFDVEARIDKAGEYFELRVKTK